jgi:hypothetical protein
VITHGEEESEEGDEEQKEVVPSIFTPLRQKQ